MRHRRLARSCLRASLLAVTLVAAAGCRSWRPATPSIPAARAIADARGRTIRLSSRSIERVEVRGARVEGDSVVGQLPARVAAGANPRVAMALADVLSVERRRVSVGRTALAVGGAMLGALAIWAALIGSSDGIELGT